MKNTRKFKLIKEYPGSPELGFITDETMYSSASYPEFWEEIEEPLFTTEDGVSIYENDIVRWCMDFKWLYKSKFVKEHLILDFKNDYKIFSTKKAAKKMDSFKSAKIFTSRFI